MSDVALKRPGFEAGADAPAPFEANSIYEMLREDIIEGRLAANERLVVSALAARYGASTNPVREALQQLRGEGFVVIVPNRGARVRAIDEDFLRDTNEIEMLIEPYFTRWFVGVATDEDVGGSRLCKPTSRPTISSTSRATASSTPSFIGSSTRDITTSAHSISG